MRTKPICLLLVVVCGIAAVLGCGSDSLRGTTLPELPFSDFTLIDQHGKPFTLSRDKGEVTLMFFGFTFCPDVCPLTLSTWKQTADQLTDETGRVKFVYVTVDPERDTPEKLKTHLAVFSPDFIGLTGETAQLDSVYSNYGVIRERVEISESAAGYLMNHTSSIYFLDRNGIWVSRMSNDAKPEDIAHDVKVLLSR